MVNTLDLALGASLEFAEKQPEDDTPDLPLMIHGKSMHAGYIKNKGTILPKTELDNIVNTLKNGFDGNGAYILKDHGYKGGLFSPKSVDLVVGRITDATHDGKTVSYSGRIEDPDIAHKIKTKLVSASSIGIHIGKYSCSICGRNFGDEECNHRINKAYPDEGLHDIASEYLDDMDGVPTCAVVCEDIRALEQSIVLFPAIEGANVEANSMFNFSTNIEEYLIGLDTKKEDKTVINDETFNKGKVDIVSGKTKMATDENTFDFEAVTNQITDLKTDKKLLEASVTSLESEKGLLEASAITKDTKISDLSADITAKDAEITSLKELVTKYTANENARVEAEKKEIVGTLTALRVEKGLATKDYQASTLEMLKSELELISEFKAANVIQGSVGNEDDPDSDAKKALEAKEDIREMIFHSRKDEKALKGIRAEKDLTNRVN